MKCASCGDGTLIRFGYNPVQGHTLALCDSCGGLNKIVGGAPAPATAVDIPTRVAAPEPEPVRKIKFREFL